MGSLFRPDPGMLSYMAGASTRPGPLAGSMPTYAAPWPERSMANRRTTPDPMYPEAPWWAPPSDNPQDALAAVLSPTKGFGAMSGGVQPAFAGTVAGRRALTADLGAMAKAEESLAAGAKPADVVRESGWWSGPEGGMRYEISDASSAMTRKSGQRRLEEYLIHPELYAAYPEIRGVKTKVKIDPSMSSAEGGFSPSRNEIWVNAPDREQAHNALLHEANHWVQGKENFPRGSSSEAYTTTPEMVQASEEYAKSVADGVDVVSRLRRRGYEEMTDGDDFARAVEEIASDLGISSDQAYNALFTQVMNRGKGNRLPEIEDALSFAEQTQNKWLDDYIESMTGEEALQKYKRTFGEIESRAVQKRWKMKADELRNRPFWMDFDIKDPRQWILRPPD